MRLLMVSGLQYRLSLAMALRKELDRSALPISLHRLILDASALGLFILGGVLSVIDK
ncbi:hypothetical protein ACFSFY_01925 [Sporosarcina siberiensis]|uniref:Uncharacterized protein n=1 Tax=Sporosarcina siberiensis TaxID=1365606 RepID=A0ABW4SDF4_9BACL